MDWIKTYTKTSFATNSLGQVLLNIQVSTWYNNKDSTQIRIYTNFHRIPIQQSFALVLLRRPALEPGQHGAGDDVLQSLPPVQEHAQRLDEQDERQEADDNQAKRLDPERFLALLEPTLFVVPFYDGVVGCSVNLPSNELAYIKHAWINFQINAKLIFKTKTVATCKPVGLILIETISLFICSRYKANTNRLFAISRAKATLFL